MYTVEAIGQVRHDIPEEEVPRRRREMVSEIVILDRYAAALEGIEEWSHLFVLFWMHKVERGAGPLQVHPRHRAELPRVGVWATRGRERPNPIGLAVAELLDRRDNVLRVCRLDAYDGTPVLDLKPYDPYDVFPELRVPQWWREMTGQK